MTKAQINAEQKRLAEVAKGAPWRKWGPYLSERQWGTVREDYSQDGDAWSYFPHDHARSRAYRSGEDGLAGFSDEKQRLCFALALWNGNDPILKERLFGLTGAEGNHGEDVKEYYFYLDSTPTHSYMKWLYKYPHRAYPYDDLVETNRSRSRQQPEYELLDTGIFADDRYFNVGVEYAKATPEDVLIRITLTNRGPAAAMLHVLPTLWFRNAWTGSPKTPKPTLRQVKAGKGIRIVEAAHTEVGRRWLCVDGDVPLLFTENETNTQRLFKQAKVGAYVKDGINDYVVHGRREAVNPAGAGTKVAAHHALKVKAGETVVLRLRLTDSIPGDSKGPFAGFDRMFENCRNEADEFYRTIIPAKATEDEARVMRQALAGMLWSKQYYLFDVDPWLKDHGADSFSNATSSVRNHEWRHMVNDDIISMPDKWEYPWYAAWDLAFHTIALSAVDIDFAKQQLDLMLRPMYIHPSGQIPAYEWNFSDVNPPVHAWATLALYRNEQAQRGAGDLAFLKRSFGKLLANFTWWVNRKDRFGKNVFEGGFLGLDNIGVFDRSKPLPTGGHLEQADGTAWMAFFSQNMLELAVEIAVHDPSYDDLAAKFIDHILWIAHAINHVGPDGLWDEEDGFFYDVLRLPDGSATRLKVRSVVGLLPLCATSVTEPWMRERAPAAMNLFNERSRRMPSLLTSFYAGRGHADRGLMAMVGPDRLRRILARMLDEKEFLGSYGIRALSRYHLDHPYVFNAQGQEYRVSYLPGDSDSGMFGGNSNWRGPIWMPVNMLLVRALLSFYSFYGDTFKVECPTGSGRQMNLFEVAREISTRLISIFLRDAKGRRPVFGTLEKFQTDSCWRDCILFHEYFHGDSGAGIGASHQTGWSGLVATLIELFGTLDAAQLLEQGKKAVVVGKRSEGDSPKEKAIKSRISQQKPE
ncbi:MAG TPA: glucosidase [Phycisphaerae bacterium]|nr:glucosidase [Phycisphaerae bacterium]HRY70101.1 glucosidase [Phycisphaerae bacterium]HSA27377.1 glucosidase [Phycisphaerae bacterium]